MQKLLLILVCVGALSGAPALAQVTIPNTLVAGTTIRAGDLNTNFSTLGNHALDRLSGGNVSGNITLDSGITIDGIDISTALCSTCAVTHKDLTLTTPTTGLTVNSVNIVNSTGKIPALTSTYFTSVAFDAANLTGTAAAINGAAITALNATQLTSGTVPDARFPATLPAADGAALTALNASNLSSGTAATARLGSGAGANTNFLRGDGSWAAVINVTEYNAGNSGAAITLNFATNGPIQKVTRTASATYTLTAPTYPGTVLVRFIHEASATAYTVTFSPTVKFPGGVAPTWTNSSGAIDVLSLYWDGAAWYGVQSANYS